MKSEAAVAYREGERPRCSSSEVKELEILLRSMYEHKYASRIGTRIRRSSARMRWAWSLSSGMPERCGARGFKDLGGWTLDACWKEQWYGVEARGGGEWF